MVDVCNTLDAKANILHVINSNYLHTDNYIFDFITPTMSFLAWCSVLHLYESMNSNQFQFYQSRTATVAVLVLVNSHLDLVSLPLALEATEPVSEPVTQMALELINNDLISVEQNR